MLSIFSIYNINLAADLISKNKINEFNNLFNEIVIDKKSYNQVLYILLNQKKDNNKLLNHMLQKKFNHWFDLNFLFDDFIKNNRYIDLVNNFIKEGSYINLKWPLSFSYGIYSIFSNTLLKKIDQMDYNINQIKDETIALSVMAVYLFNPETDTHYFFKNLKSSKKHDSKKLFKAIKNFNINEKFFTKFCDIAETVVEHGHNLINIEKFLFKNFFNIFFDEVEKNEKLKILFNKNRFLDTVIKDLQNFLCQFEVGYRKQINDKEYLRYLFILEKSFWFTNKISKENNFILNQLKKEYPFFANDLNIINNNIEAKIIDKAINKNKLLNKTAINKI